MCDTECKRALPHNTSIQRGTYRDDWQTPADVLDLTRTIFGRPTLDLASSIEANERVQADRIYRLENPCPDHPRVVGADVVWCNPPGPASNVKRFWDIWCECIAARAQGAFLFFNADHFRQIRDPAPNTPLAVLMFHKRLRFFGAPSSASFPSILVMSPWYVVHEYDLSAVGKVLAWAKDPKCQP